MPIAWVISLVVPFAFLSWFWSLFLIVWMAMIGPFLSMFLYAPFKERALKSGAKTIGFISGMFEVTVLALLLGVLEANSSVDTSLFLRLAVFIYIVNQVMKIAKEKAIGNNVYVIQEKYELIGFCLLLPVISFFWF